MLDFFPLMLPAIPLQRGYSSSSPLNAFGKKKDRRHDPVCYVSGLWQKTYPRRPENRVNGMPSTWTFRRSHQSPLAEGCTGRTEIRESASGRSGRSRILSIPGAFFIIARRAARRSPRSHQSFVRPDSGLSVSELHRSAAISRRYRGPSGPPDTERITACTHQSLILCPGVAHTA